MGPLFLKKNDWLRGLLLRHWSLTSLLAAVENEKLRQPEEGQRALHVAIVKEHDLWV